MLKKYSTPYQFQNMNKWNCDIKRARQERKDAADINSQLEQYANNFRLTNTLSQHAPNVIQDKMTIVNYDPYTDPVCNDMINPEVCYDPAVSTHRKRTSTSLGFGEFVTIADVSDDTEKTRARRILKATTYNRNPHSRNDGGPYDTRKWGPRSVENYYFARYNAHKLHKMSYYVESKKIKKCNLGKPTILRDTMDRSSKPIRGM